jgi:uncharacterized protein
MTSQSAELGADLGPILGQDRISSIDTIRGVALFGILLMNIVGFGLPSAYSNPTNYGGAEGLNLIAWIMNNMFFEGTMRGMFSMLFGAGIILMTSRAEERGGGIEVADIYYRRTLWLFAFGVVHSWLLLWFGDILYWYGIGGLFLFVFRKARPRTLIILGLLVLATAVPKYAYEQAEVLGAQADAQAAQTLVDEGEELSDEQQEAIDGWQEILDDHNPSAEELQEAIDGKQGNYFDVIASNTGFLIWMQSTGLYLYFFWDTVGMMLIGMGLLKLGVLTGTRSTRFYVTMMIAGYAVGLSVNAYETQLLMDNNFDVLSTAKSHLTYDLGRLPTTLGHIGLLTLICRISWLNWLTSRLAAVGRMALTNYITHSVICAIVFTGVGFAMFGELERFQLYYVVGAIWLAQLIISPIWMKHFRFGPLEWLWRSLTYNQRQPMRR